jgi:hypothetical protein
MIFQYYTDDVKKNKLIGKVELTRLIKAIKDEPPPKMGKIYDEIAECRKTGNEKRKSELKQHLYYFIPTTLLDGKRRAYKNIIAFTGALHLDFDHLQSNEYAKQFRDDLFNTYDCIMAAWISSSGVGVKALVKIPISKDVKEYKRYFWGIATKEMLQYNGFDKSPQNAVLPCFISHDPGIKSRTDYTTWTRKGDNPATVNYGKTQDFRYKIVTNEKYEKAAIQNTIKSINKIISDGHPQVRAAAVALGGYVGAGYITLTDAVGLITNLIRSNSYLSKGTDGYIRTAIEMINKGLRAPLFFNF